jgi:hypothetical protein
MKTVLLVGGMAALVLAGCSELEGALDDSEDLDAAESYAQLQEDFVTTAGELALLAPTLDADLPLNGTATYTGQTQILLDTTTRATDLVGDASLTADFAAGTVDGTLSGFYGSIDGGEIGAKSGDIVVSYGEIDAANADEVYVEVDGVLTDADNVLVVDAALAGTFRGDPVLLDEAPAGIVLNSTGDTEFELNGPAVTGSMSIVGKTGN